MVKLSADQIAGLDAGSAIPMGTPHEQINGSAPGIAGSKPKVLELPSIPVA